MFNIGSQPTLMKSVVELGDSRLELADSSSNFNADPAKDGVWVQALSLSRLIGSRIRLRTAILFARALIWSDASSGPGPCG